MIVLSLNYYLCSIRCINWTVPNIRVINRIVLTWLYANKRRGWFILFHNSFICNGCGRQCCCRENFLFHCKSGFFDVGVTFTAVRLKDTTPAFTDLYFPPIFCPSLGLNSNYFSGVLYLFIHVKMKPYPSLFYKLSLLGNMPTVTPLGILLCLIADQQVLI